MYTGYLQTYTGGMQMYIGGICRHLPGASAAVYRGHLQTYTGGICKYIPGVSADVYRGHLLTYTKGICRCIPGAFLVWIYLLLYIRESWISNIACQILHYIMAMCIIWCLHLGKGKYPLNCKPNKAKVSHV